MKGFQDFWNDMLADDALKIEIKKALNSDSLELTETQYPAVIEIGKAHGYAFTEEDIHLARAVDRELDDNELATVTGGGIDDVCWFGDKGCYTDYYCGRAQITTHWDEHGFEYHGFGECIADYACQAAWNSCAVSNKCWNQQYCNGEAL